MYIVDTNFFIQAHRLNYPLDVFSGFWAKVKQLADRKEIISIDKVKNEIFGHEDDLKRWCEKNLPSDFFKDTKTIARHYAEVAIWANSKTNHYLPKALTEFLDADEADAWLIAYALTDKDNIKIVTHEISQPSRKNKIKIPDVCIDKGVIFCNTVDLLRQLRQTI